VGNAYNQLRKQKGVPMIYNERDCRDAAALDIARKMAVAARTAPKGKGLDIIEVAVVTGDDMEALASEMEQISAERGHKFFLRDAGCVRACQCVLLVGTRAQAQGLDCGHCGYDKCGQRAAGVPCAINSVDVGIALGSAVALAADCRVDTRILFSAGDAAQRLQFLGEGVTQVYAVPVSISSKSPFFDRK
jgi:uncharacterized ferredoxin-like protein